MSHGFEPDTYDDACAVCGVKQLFFRTASAVRETYRCSCCQASLREREQARAIVETYAHGGASVFSDLVTDQAFRELKIYEPGTIGPFRRLLRGLPFYTESDFRPGVAGDTPSHQDLQCLTFTDESFDLVITSDILEHVRRPIRALQEIFRVLKPGGFHIFTVPITGPTSASRMDVTGADDVPILPPHYHGSSEGRKSLVYTDFGHDIASTLTDLRFSVQFLTPQTSSEFANKNIAIISRKPDRESPIG